MITAFTACEPNDPTPDYSFNGEWEYQRPEYTFPTVRLIVRNNVATHIEWNDPNTTCVSCLEYTILSSVLDGDTLRVQAKNVNYYLNFISYFTDDQQIMWGRTMRGYAMKPIRYDIPPLKLIKQ